MRVALDVSIQGGAEPTGVERAQATLLAALARRPELELLLCSPRPLPEALLRCGCALPRARSVLPLAGASSDSDSRATLPVSARCWEVPPSVMTSSVA
ncbi:MAG TPA: hypothetical protein VFF36_10750, partial [Planctomycetota bacterium]|nr:hypothetical protein [Planctomycetota bacterium]